MRLDVASIEANLAQLKPHLRHIAEVGYTETPPRGQKPGNANYFIAQYALAPTRVYQSIQYRYVIGVFPDPRARDQFVAANRMKLLETLGRGVSLLESSQRGE